jgi:glycosyltransferase involved in cell wall biosynthesis
MQLRLQYLIKKHNITHCLFPWTLHVPVPRLPIPITAVVYDRNWRKFPENFPYTTPATLDRITRDWVAGAKTIVTLSNSVQREVTDLCPQFAPKVRVVPAASTPVSSGSLLCEEDYSQADAVPIFYYPSTVGAHKGHFTLFQATLRLASKRYRFKVVLTGDRTGFLTGNEPMPLPIIPYVEQCREFYNENKAVLQMHIENLDLCDWQRVEQLYRCSRRVVLPSKYEGFGLPLMEALTRGCRVICSDIEPYRDQIKFFDCADFVQVFRADDFQALASHMEGALLASDSQRLSPIEATAIASRWTWYDTTLAIVSIMQEAPASRA